ncbi:PREDICTED: uncharacterized protein LOC109220243 [Nicotiana attenuata]|uniref:uncharacterized protein LOC109220243 n=1 Tax=Nicotiana attenuata TaxID=49451 RepID=UPI0009059417|nr:PREDICTED: uncharacterized protein LOC109220243 [Nicotiana attenuata]
MNSPSNLKKKSSESFGEYAVKWREQAARVKPPMDEIEMVSIFLQAQEADYFQNMMSVIGKPFAEAIKIGEMVENGLKTGRILSQSAIRATSQAIQSGSGGVANRKKKEKAAMAASGPRNPRLPRNYFSPSPPPPPQHYYPHQDVAYAMAPQPYALMNAQPYARPQQQFNQNRAPPPRNNPPHQAQYNPRPPQNNFPYNARAREPPRRTNFKPIGESYSSLFPKLVQMGLLQPVPQTRQNPESPSYRPGARCAYHSGAEGHDTEDCWTLKRAVENLIEQKWIVLKDEDVTNNPLPAHNNGPRPMADPTVVPWNYNRAVVTYKGKEVLGEANETNPTEKYLNLEDLNKAKKKRFPLKKPVSAEEAEEFFHKMKTADYEVIDQLRKSPSQVSLLSLLVSSTEHQKVLIKALNEAYVPIETTVEQLERIAERFFAINQISFSKNDLPRKGMPTIEPFT